MSLNPTVTLPVDPAEIQYLKPGDTVRLYGGDSGATIYAVRGSECSIFVSPADTEIASPHAYFDRDVSLRISRRVMQMAEGAFG